MKIKVQEALKKEIKPGKVFIYGSEEYLTRQFLKRVLKGVKHQLFYPDSLEEFMEFTGSTLFDGEVVPVLLHAEELPSKLRKKSQKEAFIKKLKSLNSFIVAAFGKLDWKSLKSEIFKEILELSNLVVESEPYSEKQIYGLIAKKFKSAGKEITPELIKYIVKLVGTDLTELKHETDKLLLYPGKLTKEAVESLLFSSGRVDPFEVVFSLVEGRSREFIKNVNHLLTEGSEPLQIVGLLQSQVRSMIEVACGRSVRLPKEVIETYKKSAKKVGLLELLKILKELHEAEFSIKIGLKGGREALTELAFKREESRINFSQNR